MRKSSNQSEDEEPKPLDKSTDVLSWETEDRNTPTNPLNFFQSPTHTRSGRQQLPVSLHRLGVRTSCHSDIRGVQRMPTTPMRQVLYDVASTCCSSLPRLPPDDAPRSVRMRLKATECETRVKNRRRPTAARSTNRLPFKMSAHIRRSKWYRLAGTSRRIYTTVCHVQERCGRITIGS